MPLRPFRFIDGPRSTRGVAPSARTGIRGTANYETCRIDPSTKKGPCEDVDARVRIACPCPWIPGAASSLGRSRALWPEPRTPVSLRAGKDERRSANR